MNVSVTYEYLSRAPETWRGEFNTGRASNAARLGLKASKAALKPRGWASIVVLVSRPVGAGDGDEE